MRKFIAVFFLFFISSLVFSQLTAASYSINNLVANSKNSDFGTTFYGQNKIVFSSSRKAPGVSNKKWDGNDQPFLDLYIGDVNSKGEIINVKPFSKSVNSKYHDAMVAFSPDLKDVYFTSNNYLHGELKSNNLKIFKATIGGNGHWTNIVTLPFNSDDYSTGQPSLSKDGKKLYFVSNMPGGYGDTDVYVVSVNEGHYGAAKNLGPTINSKYKEYTPYVDGDILYYSSNRPKGNGALDIYMAKIDGSLEAPINLGKPMNSRGDDISFIIDNEKQKGYFSSNRRGGVGDDDIYSFVQETVNPICDQTIQGVIKDKITGFALSNAFVALLDKDGNRIRRIETLADGTFYFSIKCGESYNVSGEKNGYFLKKEVLKSNNVNGFENSVTILMEEKEFITRNGKEMLNIENIEFELNSSTILKKSENALAKVVRLMEKFPSMTIEFGAHTDARGGDGYNLWLTNSRSSETVRYLISIGADPKRIVGKGYGETQLVNDCGNNVNCTDLEHRQNRRTEFVILKK